MDGDREDRTRARAHAIWEREGRPNGSHDAHWREAERELAAEDQEQEAGTPLPNEEPRQMSGQTPGKAAPRRRR